MLSYSLYWRLYYGLIFYTTLLHFRVEWALVNNNNDKQQKKISVKCPKCSHISHSKTKYDLTKTLLIHILNKHSHEKKQNVEQYFNTNVKTTDNNSFAITCLKCNTTLNATKKTNLNNNFKQHCLSTKHSPELCTIWKQYVQKNSQNYERNYMFSVECPKCSYISRPS